LVYLSLPAKVGLLGVEVHGARVSLIAGGVELVATIIGVVLGAGGSLVLAAGGRLRLWLLLRLRLQRQSRVC